jgi:hypothetical protein
MASDQHVGMPSGWSCDGCELELVGAMACEWGFLELQSSML